MKRILAAMLIISMTAGMTLQNVKASDEALLKIIQRMNRYLKNVYVRMRELLIGR